MENKRVTKIGNRKGAAGEAARRNCRLKSKFKVEFG
jgi:hypothetical protein